MITYTKLPIEEIEYLDRPEFHKEEIKFKESLLNGRSSGRAPQSPG